jgi:hypothetical protein
MNADAVLPSGKPPFFAIASWRIALIGLGFLVMMWGSLGTFPPSRMRLFSGLLLGLLMVLLASLSVATRYHRPSLRARLWFLALAVGGQFVILGTLDWIGEDRIRHWYPHPAGYGSAWFIFVCALYHLSGYHRQSPSDPKPALPR